MWGGNVIDSISLENPDGYTQKGHTASKVPILSAVSTGLLSWEGGPQEQKDST